MDVANASMLDESTAAAEAMTLIRRSTEARRAARSSSTPRPTPRPIAVVAARAEPLGIEIVVGDPAPTSTRPRSSACCSSTPAPAGVVRDLSPTIDAVHAAGGLVAVATDLLACTLLVPPGEQGADVVRRHLPALRRARWATAAPTPGSSPPGDDLRRSMPGRLVGVSVDAAGRPAHRLALQTREQHIRREKATSNICTAQVLLAVMASMYAVYHGPEGLTAIAERVHGQTARLARRAPRTAGIEVVHDAFFDTLTVQVPGRSDEVLAAALDAGPQPPPGRRRHRRPRRSTRPPTTTSSVRVGRLVRRHARRAGSRRRPSPPALARTSTYLTHPVFSAHRSETEMLRYLRSLADKDIALDRSMIPLGSCTMKLNATTEMAAVTWPEFGRPPPVRAPRPGRGLPRAHHLRSSAWLAEITGYDAVSIQPNAGSQGELAGLLAIRGYHAASGRRRPRRLPHPLLGPRHQRRLRGDGRHAGGRGGLRRRRATSTSTTSGPRPRSTRRDLAALMVTYPSTHGVFEEQHHRDLRRRPRPRWAGLRRRRQPQRARRPGPARAGSAATSATSTCTRRSASPTAAAVPGSGRWRPRPTSPRSCRTTR